MREGTGAGDVVGAAPGRDDALSDYPREYPVSTALWTIAAGAPLAAPTGSGAPPALGPLSLPRSRVGATVRSRWFGVPRLNDTGGGNVDAVV